MARMIDADRLYDQIEARYRQSSGEEHRIERSLLDAICDSPTIDAIPVEWIFEHMQILHELHNKNEYVLQWLIEMWQKEQEAQNVGTQATHD